VSTPSFFFLGAKVGDGDDADMTSALFFGAEAMCGGRAFHHAVKQHR
jgi:hypothetical protein